MKKIIFTLLALSLVIIGYTLFLLLAGDRTPQNTIIIKTPSGDIPVNDFTEHPIEVNPQGTILIKRTPDYDIVSFARGKSFLITLSRQPVTIARQNAEHDLLEALGITKEQACQLNVSLKIPGFVNLSLAGQDYHLSFCPNGKPFPAQ